ncbi:asparaginase [Flammeovirga yaeyamensis]|uniref:asparaginase n=1 Tax=Flammeovirga yaeyamensis TaxID=367791 RepID=A0AAX1N6K6_9BACT|nr:MULTISPECIES: asparaginase [Flammeovirga]ANQ49425.1 asparaginase [Flammeovirga sp. MY04]MBB3697688.1 L-asparaginase [Flammeovirga yaeyamensis]NMF35952.1 asparaginase [Flammeovirga yaeyamensis]QWG03100.1 asparaginase [Flammeovirga yaeyamensis]
MTKRTYFKTVNINSTGPNASDTSILLIYTGGTIGMDRDPKTGSLIPFDFEKIIDAVPELKAFDFELTVISLDPLIDSSDITTKHWVQLGTIIEEFYDDFDGFVILHGTDTMAFTASALSFMIDGVHKPVILTGSQLPIGEKRTDARENLMSALEIASERHESGEMLVQEVCICFNSKLLRGNRAKKSQNFNFTAFRTYNYPSLAEAGIFIEYKRDAFWKDPIVGPAKSMKEITSDVILLKIFPGMNEVIVKQMLDTPGLKGVVLESYGSGNTPTTKWFLDLLEETVKKGVVVVNISQCNGGTVMQGHYATSAALNRIGVLSGKDMTTEAALTKLMCLLSKYDNIDRVKKLIGIPLKGELTL